MASEELQDIGVAGPRPYESIAENVHQLAGKLFLRCDNDNARLIEVWTHVCPLPGSRLGSAFVLNQ